jgi:hypothetical protein
MQVWLRRVPRIPDVADDLTPRHLVAELHLERPWLEVRVERIVSAADVDDDVIAAHRLERDRHRA